MNSENISRITTLENKITVESINSSVEKISALVISFSTPTNLTGK